MNENNSKVIEYVLVILIALGVSCVVFMQANTYETRFTMIEKSIKEIQTKLQTLDVDTLINQINIKGLKQQNATPEVAPTEEKTTETTAPTAPTPAPEKPATK
jgi:hypothetical protein